MERPLSVSRSSRPNVYRKSRTFASSERRKELTGFSRSA
jgi:hypothetical protein